METLIHADIFFFVSTIATVILGVLAAIALTLAILILVDVRKFVKRAKTEGDFLLDEIHDLRIRLAMQEIKMWPFIRFIRRLIKHYFYE